MRHLRQSSLQEFAAWYLDREAAKGGARRIPIETEEQAMRLHHSGKMRRWFDERAQWRIVELETRELGDLIFLENEWTKKEGLVVRGEPDYRLLRQVAGRALRDGYLNRPPCNPKHRIYYELLERGKMGLCGADRIAICSAEEKEIRENPSARYYLLDGVGRCLPYMILLLENKVRPLTVESFVAERA